METLMWGSQGLKSIRCKLMTCNFWIVYFRGKTLTAFQMWYRTRGAMHMHAFCRKMADFTMMEGVLDRISSTERFQRIPHKSFDLRCPLSIYVAVFHVFSGRTVAPEVRCDLLQTCNPLAHALRVLAYLVHHFHCVTRAFCPGLI